MAGKKLTRSSNNVVIAGVCSGLAAYLDIDVTMVRLIWAVLTIFSAAFPGIVLYIIWALIVPKE